jgi:hypothetical protein
MNDLLNDLVLNNVVWSRIQAEIYRPQVQNEACQARIEFKITPHPPGENDTPEGGYWINVRLSIVGFPPDGREENRLFSVEVICNAHYRPVRLPAPTFERIQAEHTRLLRQLFPLLQLRGQQLLKELGLNQVQLPFDLVESPVTVQPSIQLH